MMMSMEKNGGPAFPVEAGDVTYFGASLRDYFAAKVVSALINRAPGGTGFGAGYKETNNAYAIAAYEIADAMLEVRSE